MTQKFMAYVHVTLNVGEYTPERVEVGVGLFDHQPVAMANAKAMADRLIAAGFNAIELAIPYTNDWELNVSRDLNDILEELNLDVPDEEDEEI